MHVLLMRLAGPMQSWGTQSRFDMRDTGLEPSKSGVIGLICAAMGRPREASVEDLSSLRMGVRVDREGMMGRDYHTARNVIRADGSKGGVVPSNRYYLADADFLVGLEGNDPNLLKHVQDSLASPYWPLFLGRKAFPVTQPVYIVDGLRHDCDLHQAFQTPCVRTGCKDERISLRTVIEDKTGDIVRIDQPVSSFAERRFAPRTVKIDYLVVPVTKEEPCISPA